MTRGIRHRLVQLFELLGFRTEMLLLGSSSPRRLLHIHDVMSSTLV